MDYTVWVTNNCNMRCKYCYVDGMKGKQFFMKEKIDSLIDFIKKTNPNNEMMKITFFGGEPLLNYKLIQEIIQRFEKENFSEIHYFMTTNGLLLTKEYIDYFKRKNVSLSLSWDGDEETNDINRIDLNGRGTYKRIREKYKLLKDCGMDDIRVRATVNSSTIHTLKSSISNFLEIDKEMSVIFVADYFDPLWSQDKIEELQKIVNEIKLMELHNILLFGDTVLRSCTCGGGITNYHIYTDGKVYPCSFVTNNEEFCIGNIYEGIDNNKVEQFSKNYQKHIYNCKGCDYEKYCLSYKCRYLNWSLTKSFNQAAPIVCQFENIKMCSNI